MFKLDYSDGKPIYEQIRDNLKQLIIDGILKTDEKIPSVRELAVTMAINPNTIQKAYKMLEDDGLMESHSGAKSYMCFDDTTVASVRKQLLESDATAIISSLKQMGLNKEEALALIETHWE